MNSLMFPPYGSYYAYKKPVVDVRIFYRFLKLSGTSNIEKSIIRDLIKRTITEQNRKAIIYKTN